MSVYILFFFFFWSLYNLLYSVFLCLFVGFMSRNSPLMPYETGEDFTDALSCYTRRVCVLGMCRCGAPADPVDSHVIDIGLLAEVVCDSRFLILLFESPEPNLTYWYSIY